MENKIIKLIKKKDHRGIDYIVDLYSDKISYIVNSILNGYSNKEDIEECISDVFISVYNDIHTYDNKKGKFETFVFIKAKYIALDYKRKIIKKKEYEKIKEDRLLKINENIAYESAEKEVIKKEKLKDIANFINNLKEPDKTYFYLKYFINMESKEIAKKYNTTLSSVENRLYRCRFAAAAQCIAVHGGDAHLRHPLQPAEGFVRQQRHGAPLLRGGIDHLGDIRARHKRLGRAAGDDDHTGVLALFQLGKALVQLRQRGGVQGIQGLGIVDGDVRNGILDLKQQMFIHGRHLSPPSARPCRP